jgi:hypothetical protein
MRWRRHHFGHALPTISTKHFSRNQLRSTVGAGLGRLGGLGQRRCATFQTKLFAFRNHRLTLWARGTLATNGNFGVTRSRFVPSSILLRLFRGLLLLGSLLFHLLLELGFLFLLRFELCFFLCFLFLSLLLGRFLCFFCSLGGFEGFFLFLFHLLPLFIRHFLLFALLLLFLLFLLLRQTFRFFLLRFQGILLFL